MSLIEIIQLSSATYIFTALALGVGTVLRAAWINETSKFNLTGFPAFMLLIATVICAITTVQVTP